MRGQKKTFLLENFITLLGFAGFFLCNVFANCGNECSGHGTCGEDNKCNCFQGWTLNDCSGKVCNSGTAWWGKGESANAAHVDVMCSNRGVCDYKTGECKCNGGFVGAACEKSMCEENCNFRGICESIGDMSKFLSHYMYGDSNGDGYGTIYTNWDSGMLYGCNCDTGYSGASCLDRLCPMGDDPETTGQDKYKITITTSSSGTLSGTLALSFMGYTTYFNANGNSESSSSCVTFIEDLESVEIATCTKGSVDSQGGTTYVIEIQRWPTFPIFNNLIYHTGNPSASQWICNTANAATTSGSVSCSVAVTTAGTVEYATCSNRGNCDYTTGKCDCASGYMGAACDQISSIVKFGCSESNVIIKAECLGYTGNVLDVDTSKAKATDFEVISAKANNVNVFSVRGDGRVSVHSGGFYVTDGGQTLGNGLVVTAGGFTMDTGGLFVDDGGGHWGTSASNAAASTIHATASAFTSDVVRMTTTRTSADAFNLLSVMGSLTQPALQVRGDGKVLVHKGGVLVDNGGMTIATAGLNAYQGQTIVTGGLKVLSGGASIYANGWSVSDGGATIAHSHASTSVGTFYASEESTYQGSVLKVTSTKAGDTSFNLIRLDAASDTQFTIDGAGKLENKNGFLVQTGGVSILAGGLHVQGGKTIQTGGLTVQESGATITAGGYKIDDGGAVIGNANSNTADVVTVRSTHASYTGSMVLLKSDRNASYTSVNLLEGRSGPDVTNPVSIKIAVDGYGNLKSYSTTEATTPTTGCLKTAGGIGVAKQIYSSGKMSVRDTTQSTSSTTGAIVTAGGMGIAKDLYVGGVLVVETGTELQPHLIVGNAGVVTHDDTPGTTTTFALQRSRGSVASPGVIQDNDLLGELKFQSYDGSNFNDAVGLKAVATDTGANKIGSKLVFQTSAANANVLIDRAHIDMAGQLKVLTNTEAVSTSTGSLGTEGGVAVAKSIYVSGSLVSTRRHSGIGVTLVDSLVLGHTASNTASNGIGSSIVAYVDDTISGAARTTRMGSIDTKLYDVTNATEDAQVDVLLRSGGANAASAITIDGLKTILPGTAQSTSISTGSLIAKGGLGVSKSIYTSGQIIATVEDTITNAVSDVLVFGVSTSSTSPGNGIGAGIQFGIETSDNGAKEIGSLNVKYLDVTNNEEDSIFDIQLQKATDIATAFSLSGSQLEISATTESTSSGTGSTIVSGGLSVAKSIYSSGRVVIGIDDSIGNDVTNVMILSHTLTSGTSPSTGYGAGIAMNVETGSSGSVLNIANLDSKLLDGNDGTEASSVEFMVKQNGAATSTLKVTSSTVTHQVHTTVTTDLSLEGNTVVGNALDDEITFTGILRQGLVFEGETSDSHKTTLHVVDPTTSSKTSTLKDAAGRVITTGNLPDITTTGTLTSLTVGASGPLTLNGGVNLGQAGDTLTLIGSVTGSNAMIFEGAVVNQYETTLAIADQGSDRTLTLSDASGTIVTTGNLQDITSVGTQTSLNVSGTVNLNGAVTLGNAVADTIEVNSIIQNFEGTKAIKFKGSSSEINLGLIDPTADRTIELPTVTSGTVVSTGNLAQITSTGTLTALTVSGSSTLQGSTSIGSSNSNAVTFKGTIQNDNNNVALIFHGGSNSDDRELTLKLDGPISDRTLVLPDCDGTIITTGNPTDTTVTGTLTSLTVSGDTTFNSNIDVASGGAGTITMTGRIQGASPLKLEGTTSAAAVTTIDVDDPTSSTKVITMPYSLDGTIVTTGSRSQLITLNTLTSLTVSGTTNLVGSLTSLGDTSSDQVTIGAHLLNSSPLYFQSSASSTGKITLVVPNPTSADKTITIPDATGTVITEGNLADIDPSALTLSTYSVSGAVNWNGNVEIGNSEADSLTIASRFGSNGLVNGEANTALVFQTDSTYSANTYTYFTFDEPTATHTITVPSVNGKVITTANMVDITSVSTNLPSLSVDGTTTLNGEITVGSATSKTITATAQIKSLAYDNSNSKSTALYLDGATTGDSNYLSLVLEDEAGSNTITLPDCTGTIITTGNLHQITTTGTQSTLAISGSTVVNGNTVLGDSSSDLLTFGSGGKVTGSTMFIFEGATADNHELSLSMSEPSNDRTIAFRHGGTAVTTENSGNTITGTIGTLGTATTISSLSTLGYVEISNKGSGQSTNSGAAQFTADFSSSNVAVGECASHTVTNSRITTSSIIIPTVLGVTGGSNPFVVIQEVGSGSAKIGICNIKFDAAMAGTVSVGYVVF